MVTVVGPVAFDDDHFLGVVAEHTGGQQAGHARAEHDRPPHDHRTVGRPQRVADLGEPAGP
jgi:hypothetical protein